MFPSERSGTGQSLGDVVRLRARSQGDATYLISARTDASLSFTQLATKVEWWRDVVHTRHGREGERWGVMLGDPLEFATCFIGLLCAGVWVAPLDPTATTLNARMFQERLARLRLDGVVSDRPKPPGTAIQWMDISAMSLRESDVRGTASSAKGGGVILASSGTTGTPKVVALSVAQLLAAADLVARHHGLGPSERGLSPLPLWHVNAEVVGLLATIVAGGSLVLDDRFHRTDFWLVAKRHEVTWINAVPAIIARLEPLREGEVVPSGIRFVRSASAPLSDALLEHFESTIGLDVVETYGMTEAASQICANPVNGPRKPGSVGPPVGVELRIVPDDDADHRSADEGIGHIEIRGPSVITSYDAAGYEDRFDDEGWLRTGDMGRLDEDGYLFIVGRSDDVINRGGEKIFPREIEEVVEGVEGVLQACVVGLPDDVFGRVPVLFITLDETIEVGHTGTLASLCEEVRDLLVASFARARRPVSINAIETMPSQALGKVQRHQLENGEIEVILCVAVQ